MRRDGWLLLGLSALCIIWLMLRVQAAQPANSAQFSGTALLASAPESFKRVTGPRAWSFPADHGLHPGYRNEWWYFTGNLETANGERIGYQFTLFRFALELDEAQPLLHEQRSDFNAPAVWMAHLALSDGRTDTFYQHERFAREALELAGATAQQWWLRDWQVTATDRGWRLLAQAPNFGLDLNLVSSKPIVLQGEAGYSQKGPESGNASSYYSMTRIDTQGQVRIGQQTLGVQGQSWLDREWGSSQLGEDLDGWDWFALQLADGRDLMLYRLRQSDGQASPYSAGILVSASGAYRPLQSDDFDLQPTRIWTDDQGVDWPVDWALSVNDPALKLEVRAVFDRQRWDRSVRYWEGMVDVYQANDRIGRGYLELSGYADANGDQVRARTR
ncbi:MAG: lipocalin-like domain-containing protein [Pseudomonadota bacterium]